MSQRNQILVTGAAAFIGWKVCEFLLTKPELIPQSDNKTIRLCDYSWHRQHERLLRCPAQRVAFTSRHDGNLGRYHQGKKYSRLATKHKLGAGYRICCSVVY